MPAEVILFVVLLAALLWFTRRKQPAAGELFDEGDWDRINVGERFLIEYVDVDGVVSEREIAPITIERGRKRGVFLITAYCHLRGENRTFRSDRILRTRDLRTMRTVADLVSHLVRR